MSKTIWKYQLPRDGQTIEIHEYIVEVLHIAAQDGVPTLWAVVDPDRVKDSYIEVVAWGTGWPLPEDVYQECSYWGTCGDGCGYIWHYFAAHRFPERMEWDYEGLDAYPSNIVDEIDTTEYILDNSVLDCSPLGTVDMLTTDAFYEELRKLVSTAYAEISCNTATNKCMR